MGSRPEFVYTTYINTTPKRLWQALTEPAFTQRYWSMAFETDWKAGSTITWDHHGVSITDPEQVVLESDPYRRLSYTWHTFTPELAKVFGIDDEQLAKLAAEPRSKVTFDLEKHGSTVKLTVTHDGFDHGSTVAEMVSGGWPLVISGLKTLLETGDVLAKGA
ncbi:SRPBCC family protein [Streptomyces sp. H10-C2]|uniref:SRPBCC family protein n=1 Tax=unclassified Streptomyces TaxID=2593676 RepID=UPI0024B9532A|nr:MULTISPECIES: SRPBCC family protein [unclassified Streptomyces]MDJ0345397.1 SRPBCC family protein [Streptomyces sp. PH10-H1]MDJ0372151.1 SRPBCC family protein [Streptomyces sp. H10-C2]